MIIKLDPGITSDELKEIKRIIHDYGLKAHGVDGVINSIITVLGDTSKVSEDRLMLPGVSGIIRIQEKYKLANRATHPQNLVINLNGLKIGGREKIVMAGPCAVEKEYVLDIAKSVKKAGAHILRGGAYKPRTSPHDFQGMGLDGLKLLDEARKKTGLPIITEATSEYRPINGHGEIEHVLENVIKYTDIIQIGARNAQNFDFLRRVGYLTKENKKPVMLKRGMNQPIDEFLLSAEYILSEGNPNVILCVRGTTKSALTSTRNEIDVFDIPKLKEKTHLPIFCDPSHMIGKRAGIVEMSLLAFSLGADGVIIESHTEPQKASCDGQQCLYPNQVETVVKIAKAFSTEKKGSDVLMDAFK